MPDSLTLGVLLYLAAAVFMFVALRVTDPPVATLPELLVVVAIEGAMSLAWPLTLLICLWRLV